jgi:hypothetical protein
MACDRSFFEHAEGTAWVATTATAKTVRPPHHRAGRSQLYSKRYSDDVGMFGLLTPSTR